MRIKSWITVGAAALLVAGCGGGGNGTNAYGSNAPSVSGSGSSGSSSGGSSGSSSSGSSSSGTNVASNSTGSVVLALSTTSVSASLPSTVTAVVKDASGNPVPGVLVSFNVTAPAGTASSQAVGQVSPSAAVTDSSGEAATVLSPAGSSNGAGYVNASADVGNATLTAKATFTVSASSATLTSVTPSPSSISGYASSVIQIGVNGASSSNPVTLNVSSTCSANNKAAFSPSSLTLTGSSGQVTYQDNGCSATDRINVQIAGSAQQMAADLTVAAPATTGIQYVSATPSEICLDGSGCASTSNVLFKVVDSAGIAKPGVRVDFSLDPSVASAADLGSAFASSDSLGNVSVTVRSKTQPTPLRVTAKVHGTSLQTVSNSLTISGGLPLAGNSPARSGLTIAASQNSADRSTSTEMTVTVYLVDRFGASVMDDTVVNFASDGGSVVPGHCSTLRGSCNVKLVVSNPKPTNGRVHLVAYATGQEWFSDLNNDGMWNSGEPMDDVPQGVCIDKNEDGVCGPGEFVAGNSAAPDAGNGTWDGGSTSASGTTAFAQGHSLFYFAVSDVAPLVYAYDSTTGCATTPLSTTNPITVTLGSATRAQAQLCVRDGSGNDVPLPSNSTIVAQLDSAVPSNVTVAVDTAQVPAIVSDPMITTLTVTSAGGGSPSGKAHLQFTVSGHTYTLYDVIVIN